MKTVSKKEARRRKANMLRHWYGLSLVDYEMMLARQYWRCAMCGRPFGATPKESPCVDHNHITGEIRGIIHGECNTKLGRFGDSIEAIEQALTYLKTARTPYNANAGRFKASLQRQRGYRQSRQRTE